MKQKPSLFFVTIHMKIIIVKSSSLNVFLLTLNFRLCINTAVLTQKNRLSGNNSVVECNLAKVEVASSNLVSRSTINSKGSAMLGPFFIK